MKRYTSIFLFFILLNLIAFSQNNTSWKGKKYAVVLTYDDGLDVHLKNAVPVLDSLGLKGTFYLADYSGRLQAQIPQWRDAAAKGHELANHTIYHPCEGGRPGREFVKPEVDLNNYTVYRLTNEIRAMNVLLTAIDGKTERTFAFPCGDMKLHDTAYIGPLKTQFVAARSVMPVIQSIDKVDLYNVPCYAVNGQSGDELIAWVKQAEAKGGLLVFLFHGVGGGHGMNVSLPAHSQLLHYLKQQEKNIWIAPMLEVSKFIKDQRSVNKVK